MIIYIFGKTTPFVLILIALHCYLVFPDKTEASQAVKPAAEIADDTDSNYRIEKTLSGTTWSSKVPGSRYREYVFLKNGVFSLTEPTGEVLKGKWYWDNEYSRIRMELDDHPVLFSATIENDELRGLAGAGGRWWEWTATKVTNSIIQLTDTEEQINAKSYLIPILWGVNFIESNGIPDNLQLNKQYGNNNAHVAYSNNNKLKAIIGNNKIIIIDIKTNREVIVNNVDATSIIFSPDDKYISTGTELIDIPGGKVIKEFNKKTSGSFVMSHAFTPDSKFLAVGRYHSADIDVYNVVSGDIYITLKAKQAKLLSKERITKKVEKHLGGTSYQVTYEDEWIDAVRVDQVELLAFDKNSRMLVAKDYEDEGLFTCWRYSPKGLFSIEYKQLHEYQMKYATFLENMPILEKNLTVEKQQVLQARVADMKMVRGEFEKSNEYNARIQKALQLEQQIESEFAQKLKDELAKAAQEKAEWQKLLSNSLYPVKLDVSLGNYDPDNESFSATLFENKISIPVPRDKAMELSKHKDKMTIEGKVRYYSDTHVELVNTYLTDNSISNKFAFGTHLEPIMVAATEKTPPQLLISSLTIIEPSGNGILDAGEKGKIRATLKNSGKGTAFGVNTKFEPASFLPSGIALEMQQYLGVINGGEEKVVEADIIATEDIVAGDIQIKVFATESNGFDAKPVILSFGAKALVPPALRITSLDIKSLDGKRVISKGIQTNITLQVQNAGSGMARAVAVTLAANSNDIVIYGNDLIKVGDLAPGTSKDIVFSIAVNQRYNGASTLPIAFAVKEERPRFNIKPDIKLALNQDAPEIRMVKIEAREQNTRHQMSVLDDLSLPVFNTDEQLFGENDHAVIIGIENYRSLPNVDFAYNDAKLVKAYFKGLGIPERNIDYLTDEHASFNDLKIALETRLKNRVRPNSRVIVYYAGHGAPEPSTGQAFLVPYDGNPNYLLKTGYSLKLLYDNLAQLNVRETMVLLDACFSGVGGRSVLAAGARALVMRIDESTPGYDNMLLFSSTKDTQISTSFPEKKHGLFTYFFLKAIKEGKKDMASVYESIKPLVEDESKRQNVEQSPTVKPSLDSIRGRFALRK